MESFTYEVWKSDTDLRKAHAEKHTVIVVHKENSTIKKTLFNVESWQNKKETQANRKRRRIRRYLLNNDNDLSKKELKAVETVKMKVKRGKGRKRRYITINADKETINRLLANSNFLIHARTRELILATSILANKRIPRIKTTHLRRFPRVNYHNQTNKPCSRIFKSKDDLAKWINGDNSINSRIYQGKPTKQFKTVWFTKNQRRQ